MLIKTFSKKGLETHVHNTDNPLQRLKFCHKKAYFKVVLIKYPNN